MTEETPGPKSGNRPPSSRSCFMAGHGTAGSGMVAYVGVRHGTVGDVLAMNGMMERLSNRKRRELHGRCIFGLQERE